MNKKLSIRELFSLSWNDFKKNWKIAILAPVPLVVLNIIDGFFGVHESGHYNEQFKWISTGTEGSFVVSAITIFAGVFITIGLTKIYLNITDGKKAEFKQNFSEVDSVKHYFMYLLTYLTSSLSIIISAVIIMSLGWGIGSITGHVSHGDKTGLIILLISAIVSITVMLYVALTLQFSYYFSIENRYHFIKAIRKSWSITKGYRWKLFVLTLTVTIFNFFGILALGIGLLVTIPTTMLIYSHAYRKLDPEVSSREMPAVEKVEIEVESNLNKTKEK